MLKTTLETQTELLTLLKQQEILRRRIETLKNSLKNDPEFKDYFGQTEGSVVQ